ncbi:MAG: hypothetical protein J6Z11_01560 [Candidatus Riflebacteria bacterium]|nr:hypothetical protein [Candidatus Riflebacteria bacterium]
MTHPFTILRAKKLVDWVKKGEFTQVTGITIEDVEAKCASKKPDTEEPKQA